MPPVNVVVVNDAGEILLIRRSVDLGESVAQAALRETLEESGSGASSRGWWASTPIPGT